MAYSFSVANTPATGAVAIYLLISTMVTAGWTKVMDSDGTTYSSAGTQVTSGGAGAGGLANSKAWVRMRAPTVNGGSVVNQQREITFQRNTANNTQWRVKYSASAGFTGGSPSATVTPSSTDEIFLFGDGTDAVPTFGAGGWFTTDGNYRWHIACGGSAEFYSFVAFALTSGGTTGGCAIALDVMQSGTYSALDVDPAVMYFSSAHGNPNAGIGEIATSEFKNLTSANPCQGRAWYGPTSALGGSVVGNSRGITMCGWGNQAIGGGGTAAANPWTTNDDLLPALYGIRTNAVFAITGGGAKGFSTLFRFGSVNRTNLDTCDTVATKDKIFFGTMWLPWNGSVPVA